MAPPHSRAALEERVTPQRVTKSQKEVSELVSQTAAWAKAESESKGLPGPAAVVGLDPKQKDNIAKAVEQLSKLLPGFQGGGQLQPVDVQLKEAIGHAKEAKKQTWGNSEEARLEARASLRRSADATAAARNVLLHSWGAIDVGTVVPRLDAAIRSARDLARAGPDDPDAVADIVAGLEAARKVMKELGTKQTELGEATEHVLFALRSFLALNVAGYDRAPTSAESKRLKASLSGIQADFELLFPNSGVNAFALFEDYANTLEQQLEARQRMEAAGVPTTTPIPGKATAESYFKALIKSSNTELADAYHNFAAAYFYHRGVTDQSDLTVSNVDQLFARQASITGTRPLVCTGYALLGASLLALAGGTNKEFIVGVRASRNMLLSGTDLFEDAHALAAITRRGATFFVSNDTIVGSEQDGIGPDAVAWADKDSPLFVGRGSTIAKAGTAAVAKLVKARNKLKAKAPVK